LKLISNFTVKSGGAYWGFIIGGLPYGHGRGQFRLEQQQQRLEDGWRRNGGGGERSRAQQRTIELID